MNFFIKHCNLDKEKTDCIIVGIFKSSQLSSSANHLNKCSNNYIISLVNSGDIQGEIGETLMLYNVPNIVSKRILLVGCGNADNITISNFKKILKSTTNILKKISIKNIIYSFTELNITGLHINIKNNIYWNIRFLVLSIQSGLYNIVKINTVNPPDQCLYIITLNILRHADSMIGQKSLNHALAIYSGIKCAKNISNLPPNICTPLYLSRQAKKLSKKYKDNICVEILDIKKMKTLGMNAYLSVGQGAKNKPFMSVIEYCGESFIKNKVIALVGKGLTFDSGGISIKPALHMHEMKYDMCGAAAVYGTMMIAAQLKLPLKIIGILSGCENMLGSNAFRPGDVLTTMSGKTVEILNTDAEGRLVLADSLTYLKRFSPDMVIDIATLTGACVIALGESISGFFSNNEDLAYALNYASEETDDKIWRLPLFLEYKNQMISNIADLSNIGKSKAGAITAACFLSNFTEKYSWAHLDIAGTAWKSHTNSRATGRPVELLAQFLLNISESKYF